MTQVIAPYLVILRVANRKALTSKMISGPGNISSLHFESQGTTLGGDESRHSTSSMGANGEVLDAPTAGGGNTIKETPPGRLEKDRDVQTPR